MTHLYVSAAHKSSGKTTIATGLTAALVRRGMNVGVFKKGPDFIDPMWLGLAAGRPCYNLDFHTMGKHEILATFATHSADADVSVIEGNKGLYDGLDLDGGNSNAGMAALLGAPVVLVLDARGMTRGIAPLILGYQNFDKNIRIAGVILNNIGGSRHEGKLRDIIEHYTDVPILGSVHRQPALEISERHLGLIPSIETHEAGTLVSGIADVIAREVDLDAIIDAAKLAGHPAAMDKVEIGRSGAKSESSVTPRVRIAIAQDSAFGFYYPDDLAALKDAGAELVPVNTMADAHLPDVDGLFIGGGFPESHLRALEANVSLRRDIRNAIEAGLPTYAECGGLMYLARSLSWQGQMRKMVGVIPGDAVMHQRPQGRGYTKLAETGQGPWPLASGKDGQAEITAHEFHYASIENLQDDPTYAFDILRGVGVDGKHDGIVYKNLLAGFVHQRHTEANPWAKRFVDFVARCKADGLYKIEPRSADAENDVAENTGPFSRVHIVGAGPGDPGLLTVRAKELLEEADVIVYDRLVSDGVLDLVPPGTTRVFAGKAARDHFMKQSEINDLLVKLAKSGRRVVRLKGGDPFIFGRGSEEASHLVQNGIDFEVVPGITAATGCTARAGIPLTHRNVSRSVTFVTGHRQGGGELDLNWPALADPDGTSVIYMGLINAREISEALIRAGLPGYTPAAVIEKGTTPEQRTVITTVAELPDCIKAEEISAPALLIIGQVVEISETLNWASAVIGCGEHEVGKV